jgi:hypothetical protein
LSLFGFDLIQDADSGKFAIIDMNYLPGKSCQFLSSVTCLLSDFVGVEDFHPKLLDHLLGKSGTNHSI